MSPEQFAYWLQGFAELCPEDRPSAAQWQAIKDHLNTVFVKVTPQLGKFPSGTPTPATPPVPPTVPSMPPVTPLPYFPPRITDWPDTINPIWRGPQITCSAGDIARTAVC